MAVAPGLLPDAFLQSEVRPSTSVVFLSCVWGGSPPALLLARSIRPSGDHAPDVGLFDVLQLGVCNGGAHSLRPRSGQMVS